MEQLREAFPMIDPNDLTGILGMAGGDPDVACDIVNEILSQLPPDEPGADLGYVTVGAAPDLPGALARLGRRGWVSKLPYITTADDLGELTDVLTANYSGEFCVASSFDPDFITRLIYQGYLTMCEKIGAGEYILLPKLHSERCILQWADLHMEKNARKRSKRFTISVNQSFDGVFDGCVEQHGENWLHKPLRRVLKSIFDKADGLNGVRVHTMELWDENGQLVAGELATTVGGSYTALSGFRLDTVASSGTIQMLCTAKVLAAAGFDCWDMGMAMDYKSRLGAKAVPRKDFLADLRRVRDQTEIKLEPFTHRNAQEVICGRGVAAVSNSTGGGGGEVHVVGSSSDTGANGSEAAGEAPMSKTAAKRLLKQQKKKQKRKAVVVSDGVK